MKPKPTKLQLALAYFIVGVLLVLIGTGVKVWLFDQPGSASLDPARASDIEGVPIPAGAEIPTSSPEDKAAMARFEDLMAKLTKRSSPATRSVAYHVPGVTFETLVRWYNVQLPDRRGWAGWTWCEGLRWNGEGRRVEKTYYHPGTTTILYVAVYDGSPPYILVAHGWNEPCR